MVFVCTSGDRFYLRSISTGIFSSLSTSTKIQLMV
ncbi:hypothetical protein H310_08459 [Aphanomyces invadans]|uniref:Uncharacterized protein n=1 Tax=Aphanomyces invadans TaxID=157072 RepID=A0A024TZD1_9STRA|nr:hypothetical protein H310_08459 [Aphanomyces invadans]ETV98986.1 hypothetical protein H310_08459 [Aphanomyces invadans]|eukprot:XP_008872414.1 hypothetical protein H310_08459 [Aphanomyces invadans]